MLTKGKRPRENDVTSLTMQDVFEISRALQHVEDLKKPTANGNLLDLMMLNGKRLGDCTGREVRDEEERVAKLMKTAADKLDELQKMIEMDRQVCGAVSSPL